MSPRRPARRVSDPPTDTDGRHLSQKLAACVQLKLALPILGGYSPARLRLVLVLTDELTKRRSKTKDRNLILEQHKSK